MEIMSFKPDHHFYVHLFQNLKSMVMATSYIHKINKYIFKYLCGILRKNIYAIVFLLDPFHIEIYKEFNDINKFMGQF